MKLELKRGCEDYSETLDLEEAAEDLEIKAEGATFCKPIGVRLAVTKSQDQMICRGEVRTQVSLECSRCLTQYEQSLTSDIDFVIDLAGGADAEKSEEDGYFVADPSSPFFEIDDLVKESLILSLPLKPLCSEDCKGLCPICGVDLNKKQCDCVKDEIDPRWEQLKVLRKKKS
jgi:uncharacterized protein